MGNYGHTKGNWIDHGSYKPVKSGLSLLSWMGGNVYRKQFVCWNVMNIYEGKWNLAVETDHKLWFPTVAYTCSCQAKIISVLPAQKLKRVKNNGMIWRACIQGLQFHLWVYRIPSKSLFLCKILLPWRSVLMAGFVFNVAVHQRTDWCLCRPMDFLRHMSFF